MNFSTWFVKQHGARTQRKAASDTELQELISRGEQARVELAQRQIWDEQRKSALYAWQARDKEVA